MAWYRRMNWKWMAPLVLALSSCAGPRSDYSYAKEPDPRGLEYVFGPADEIAVAVWGVPDLEATARVRPDGSVTLALIGDVRAAGRTPSELRSEIQERLKKYIKDESAVVSIAVVATHSYRVIVTGRVTQPGVVESDHYMTVHEAIARAGGTTPFAKSKRVVLVRHRPDGSVVRIPIRYDLVESGLSPEQDLVLHGGDQLHVP